MVTLHELYSLNISKLYSLRYAKIRTCDKIHVQCVREALHVFDFNLIENALRYFDAVFLQLKISLMGFYKIPYSLNYDK